MALHIVVVSLLLAIDAAPVGAATARSLPRATAADRTIDPALRRLARADPHRRMRAVVRLDASPASASGELLGLAVRGVVPALDRHHAPVRVGRYHVIEGSASELLAVARDGAHVRLDRPTVEPVTTGEEIGTLAVAAHGPVPMQGPRGGGMKILDFERGLDVYHPHFFEADGGAHPWVDLDGDGVLTPGVDGLDTDLDGEIAPNEHLRLLDYALARQVDGGWQYDGLENQLQPAVDYLYIDFDGNEMRDYGPAYAENTPGYGEPLLLPDDADGDGTITIDERVILLRTSKISAYRDDGIVYRRGEDLVDVGRRSPNTTGHGTAVLGSLVGGQDRLFRRHRGVVPDVEVLLFDASDGDLETYADGFAWGIDEGVDVMLHEYALWSREQLDGSGAYDALIDESTAAGVVNVCPAGNLGAARKHTSAIADAAPVTFAFHVPASILDMSPYTFVLDLHWRDPDVVVQCAVTSPSGETVQLVEGGVVAGTDAEIGMERWDSERGTSLLLIEGFSTSQGSLTGAWSVACTHDAPGAEVHAYLDDLYSVWGVGVEFDAPVAAATLCTPSTADTCIAVGAYAFENPYDDAAGTLASYSSQGPRISGGKTIDVAAPADPTVPYPSIDDPEFGTSPYLWQNNYRSFSGTSGAGPHVAAVAALLLEAEPGLSPAQVRERVVSGATTDGDVDGVDRWGAGKLRAHGTLYGEDALPPPELVDAGLTVAFAATEDGCVATVAVDGMDWTAPSARWDLDYDGTWDTEFVTDASRGIAVDERAPEIAVRVEYGGGGWRIGGAALAAIAPASCFEIPTSDSSSGESASSEAADSTAGSEDESSGGAAQHGDDGGCGCVAPSSPRPASMAWALALFVVARRRAAYVASSTSSAS